MCLFLLWKLFLILITTIQSKDMSRHPDLPLPSLWSLGILNYRQEMNSLSPIILRPPHGLGAPLDPQGGNAATQTRGLQPLPQSKILNNPLPAVLPEVGNLDTGTDVSLVPAKDNPHLQLGSSNEGHAEVQRQRPFKLCMYSLILDPHSQLGSSNERHAEVWCQCPFKICMYSFILNPHSQLGSSNEGYAEVWCWCPFKLVCTHTLRIRTGQSPYSPNGSSTRQSPRILSQIPPMQVSLSGSSRDLSPSLLRQIGYYVDISGRVWLIY